MNTFLYTAAYLKDAKNSAAMAERVTVHFARAGHAVSVVPDGNGGLRVDTEASESVALISAALFGCRGSTISLAPIAAVEIVAPEPVVSESVVEAAVNPEVVATPEVTAEPKMTQEEASAAETVVVPEVVAAPEAVAEPKVTTEEASTPETVVVADVAPDLGSRFRSSRRAG